MARLPANLKMSRDGLADLRASLATLANSEVLVGFPEETTERGDAEEIEESKGPITNAALGYIHDNGSPEVNIPARPFMIPGIENAKEAVTDKLGQMARAVVTKGAGQDRVAQGFEQVGSIAELAIKNKINEGIPPPLSEYTLQERARKGRKGAKEELALRAKGEEPGTQLAKPLVDTAQMRNSVKYVVRARRARAE